MTSVHEWQLKLKDIYPNSDKSPDYMMAHAYTACSDLARLLLRSEKDHRRETAIISTLSWLLSLSSHFEIDYEGALVTRFPSVCSYCVSRPCECDQTNKRARHRSGRLLSDYEIEEELRAKYNSIRNSNTKVTWGWIIGQLSTVYPSNRALLQKGGHGYVVGKMLEEGGELHRAYSGYLLKREEKKGIEVEIADLTAWVISCWDLEGSGRDLDAEFASTYASGCFKCKVRPCTCPTYSITRGQEELFREVISQLRSLETAGAGRRVTDALRLADAVAKAPTTEAKRSLLQELAALLASSEIQNPSSGAMKKVARDLDETAEMLKNWVSE